ncbi:hypothetical protein E2C01_017303 [Portunus trituberculatus]|uniref:Uncharacterized protein n=1 Tax=Portunus trituberculatus TaxID=210409 RepID=A0A5B7DTE7_PORTR|nr:hypothetical protein [Portunus trituberculatus]
MDDWVEQTCGWDDDSVVVAVVMVRMWRERDSSSGVKCQKQHTAEQRENTGTCVAIKTTSSL